MTTALNTTTNTNIHLTTNTGGVVTTTTTEVAEIFGRQHKNVIQAIDKIECSDEFSRLNFQPAEYQDKQGKIRKRYNLTKDGFVFLAMGFNGKKAAKFKELYINEFNRMEAILKNKDKEVELGRVRHNPDAWITTAEIATLFDQEEGAILEIATKLRDFANTTPWDAMGVRISTTPEDDNSLYLNPAAFLLLDLGNSLEVRKQKFRVIGAFEDYENQRYMDEQQDETDEAEERKNDIADFKYSIKRVNELGEQLIFDIEWKNNLTDESKTNTISVAISMLDSLSKNIGAQSSKFKQEVDNVKSLLANTQQYEKHINRELLDRLSLLNVQLISLKFSPITKEIIATKEYTQPLVLA